MLVGGMVTVLSGLWRAVNSDGDGDGGLRASLNLFIFLCFVFSLKFH